MVAALFVSPAHALTGDSIAAVSKAPPKGSAYARSSVSSLADLTFASSIPVTGTLDAGQGESHVYPFLLAAGESISATLTGEAGTDFDLYLFWPDYEGPDEFDVAAAGVSLSYPEDVTFDVAWPGTYYLNVSAYSGAGEYSLTVDVSPAVSDLETTRLSGPTRYETAVSISSYAFQDGSSRDVVLASGASYPDALSASALAGALGSPLLLTRPDRLPDVVVSEIQRLGAVDAHVIGGPAAVSTDVDRELEQMGIFVTRYEGRTRYGTSASVARAVSQLSPGGELDLVFVARGDEFPDALVAAPFAYGRGYPVLLTYPDTLAAEAAVELQALAPDEAIVLGSVAAVSEDILLQVEDIVGQAVVDRVGGPTRYETASEVTRYAVRRYWATTTFMGVASGVDYPDALTGGSATGLLGGVLVLTDPYSLSTPARDLIYENRILGLTDTVAVFGGEPAVSTDTYDAIEGVVTW